MSDIYLGKYTELIQNIVQSYNDNDRITCRMYMEEHDKTQVQEFLADLERALKKGSSGLCRTEIKKAGEKYQKRLKE